MRVPPVARHARAAPAAMPRWRAQALWLRADTLIGLGAALAAFCLYWASLLPGLGSRDTAELQWVVPTLGLAHPTGYPLYTMLGWLWCQLPLGGTMAWRLSLFSGLAAAAAVSASYHVARALAQPRPLALAAALALAVSRAFWSQATIAEVYALAALIQALLLLALLRWRAGRWPLWAAGLLAGLGLAHHRSIILLLPGALLFVALSWRLAASRARLSPRTLAGAALALVLPLALYAYVPLRAPAWMHSWPQVFAHISGSALTATWLDPSRLRAEGVARLRDLARQFIWPQFLPVGFALALLGGMRLARRDRAAAALLIAGYALVCAFCAAYYVDDIEVFFIPAHQIAALLLGEGALVLLAGAAAALCKLGQPAGQPLLRALPCALLLLPAALFWQNLPAIRALNTTSDEQIAREIMAQPLPQGALIIGDWYATEGPHYLQVIEHQRPDLQFGSGIGRADVLQALDGGRAVYLTAPDLSLGLAQSPEGRLWRLGRAPLAASTSTSYRWQEGIALSGFTLAPQRYRPGDMVPMMLQWQAHAVPGTRYRFFVHLVGPDGTIWGQCDQSPAQESTDRWQAGKRYADLIAPALAADAPAGSYRVTLGWYEYPAMQRLPLAGGADDFVILGKIEVAR